MRALNLFEEKSILDYNKTTLCNAMRYNCVRAKELDDNLGALQSGSYFTSMFNLSNAIRQELGLEAAPLEVVVTAAKLGKKDNKALIRAQSELSEANETVTEQTAALETQEQEINTMAEQIKVLTSTNKKLTSTNKKLAKGAK
jgi:hypothetical protein